MLSPGEQRMKSEAAMARSWTVLIGVLILLVVSTPILAGSYSGGSGTPEDPFQISVVADWKSLMVTTIDWSKHFILTADIDLVGENLVPVGNQANVFTGNFNGDGFKLLNVTMYFPTIQYVGLFGRLGSSANISNLTVLNLDIVGNRYVGSLAGNNSGTIMGCSVEGHVAVWTRFLGGLVGDNWGTISECSFKGSVYGSDWYVGGLVGRNNGSILLSHAKGSVTGYYVVGGLVADNYGPVSSCSAGGLVIGNKSYVGGLIGNNAKGTIISCSATSYVEGLGSIGGLVGYNSDNAIISCSASIQIRGDGNIGGLIGTNYGSIISSSASGYVTGTLDDVGGLVGFNNGTITNCSYTTGIITGNHYETGGLVGSNYGRIELSYSSGWVNGLSYVGGLVGSSIGELYSSYTACSVTASDSYAGGLCGDNLGMIRGCYAIGSVKGGSLSGGLCGNNSGEVNSCFWNTDTSGMTSSAGGEGVSYTEMMTFSTFTGAGWDFVGESANGTADVWRMCANDVDYPRLSWEFSHGGDFDCPDGVGSDDLLYLANRWLATNPETIGAADANIDGKADLADFAILAAHWLK
jgi:hypothetical protein